MDTQIKNRQSISESGMPTQKASNFLDKVAKFLLLLGVFGALMQWMGSAGLFRSGAFPQAVEVSLELIRTMLWSFAIPAVLAGLVLLVVAHRHTSNNTVPSPASRGWLILINLLALLFAVAIGFLFQLANIDNSYPTFMERLYPVVGALYFIGVLISVIVSQNKRSYSWAILPSLILFGLLFVYSGIDWLLKMVLK